MRNRGAIIFVTIVLVLLSLYYLSFTVVTKVVESKAKDYAVAKIDSLKLTDITDIQKKSLIDSVARRRLDSMENEVVYPMIRKYTYMDCKERELNLGLDLRGGMNISLEISAQDVLVALSSNKTDSTFVRAIREARNQAKNQTGKNFINTFAETYNAIKTPISPDLASLFVNANNKDRISMKSTDDEILKYLHTEYEAAIANANDVLMKRIDQFGVVQPNIQKDVAVEGVFHIELPGIKDPERVEALLRQTAVLDFWETYEAKELSNQLIKANEILTKQYFADKNLKKAGLDKEEEVKEEVITEEPSKEKIAEEEIISDSTVLAENAEKEQETDSLDENQMSANVLFERLQPNVNSVGPVIGFARDVDRESVMRDLSQPQIRNLFPKDLEFAWSFKADKNSGFYQLIALKRGKNGGAVLNGSVVTNATQEFGQNRATAEVSMTMTGAGATEWARITAANVGKSIAIVLDGYVYSYPTVNGEITGGRSSITGNFTLDEATDLANVLKSGKMPAPAHILSKEVVGPSLGQKAIDSGLISFVIAFLLVIVYIIFYYDRAGLVASVALIVNLFFIMGVLVAIGAVLTLPGIAGIVLTIGMSVDANVLIFERTKEEIRLGKNVKTAVTAGYSNAMSAIIDSNLTTIIIGIVLYFFGIGPVKGFATTLIIGILCSLFTAIFITKLIFTAVLDKNKKMTFGNKFTINAFQNLNINFIGKRKYAYIASGLVILICIISLATRKLNPGIDFAGGRNYVVNLKKVVPPEDVANALTVAYGENTVAKIYGADNQLKVTTKYKIDEDGFDAKADELLYKGFHDGGFIDENVSQEEFFTDYRQSSEKVGPAVSQDITSKSIIAVAISLIFMFIYILIRFRKWQYSLSAVIALMHDSIIVIGIFSLFYSIMPFSMEIDQAFIAAVLTVIGYSINDTVVIFDRIRENHKLYPNRDDFTLLNSSINSTINRTINTSLSTIVVLLAIYIFGGEVIRGFVFAILIGIVIGTYSSIFVAVPLSFDFTKNKKVKKIQEIK